MKIGLLVEYNAIKWDNYQGGSGKPYDGILVISIDVNLQAHHIQRVAEKSVNNLEKNDSFIGEARVKKISIVTIKEGGLQNATQ